jgi:hypothetical protein
MSHDDIGVAASSKQRRDSARRGWTASSTSSGSEARDVDSAMPNLAPDVEHEVVPSPVAIRR